MDSVKENTKSRVSNEQILEAISKLSADVDTMRADIDRIKNPKDQVVRGMPEKRNFNDDPGPWTKKVDPVSEEERQAKIAQLNEQIIEQNNSK